MRREPTKIPPVEIRPQRIMIIAYKDALHIIHDAARPAALERIALLRALGETIAEDILSPIDLPLFRNSAVDGFAIKTSDLPKQNSCFVYFDVLKPGAEGKTPTAAEPMSCIEIMTGAMMPDGYDAVVPFEDTIVEDGKAAFPRTVRPSQNVRQVGEDITAGSVAVHTGEMITPERIMLLAAIGCAEVPVRKIPSLHFIAIHSELPDRNREPLRGACIHDANSPYLMARCIEEGLQCTYHGIVADDAAAFVQLLSTLPSGAIVVATGAVSKGKWDFIPTGLEAAGASIRFHQVNIRPGKPVLFAILPGGGYFFGLPDNPIAAAVGLRFFLMPLIRALKGLPPEKPILARLNGHFRKKGPYRHFLKAALSFSNNGVCTATLSAAQESFSISPMAACNAWVIAEEEQMEFPNESLVAVLPFASRFTAKGPRAPERRHHASVAAVILAGGRSARMGEDKAELSWHGHRLIDHVADTLRDAGIDELHVSGIAHGYRCIPDAGSHMGPAAGICASILALRDSKKIFFAAVDMPLLDSGLIHRLLALPSNADAQYFHGHPLPLCIRVSPAVIACAQEVTARMLQGRSYSISALLTELAVHRLSVVPAYERQLANFNTPEEWRREIDKNA